MLLKRAFFAAKLLAVIKKYKYYCFIFLYYDEMFKKEIKSSGTK